MSSRFDIGSVDIQPAQTRIIYQWLRVEQLDQWWHWGLLAVVCVAVLTYVVFWYRRDSVEHPRAVGWALMLLRVAALSGLLLYFFQLDKRTEQRVVRDSRVAVLVDTSLSMSLPGTPSEVGIANSLSRSEEAARLIGESAFLDQLSERHQVSVYRFDQTSKPTVLAAISKSEGQAGGSPADASQAEQAALERARQWMIPVGIVGGVALLCLSISLGAQVVGMRNWSGGAWLLLGGSSLALVALASSCFPILSTTRYPLASLLGLERSPLSLAPSQPDPTDEDEPTAVSLPDDWAEALRPGGAETRLGDAIKSVLDRELGSPLAGLIVLTDGRSNAGRDPVAIISSAQNARVPLYLIGFGSERNPPNVQLVEIDVPKRLYPGDRFSLSALVSSTGFEGRTVTVQVTSGSKDAPPETLSIEAEQQIRIPSDGEVTTAQFELEPKTVGEWQYAVKVIPLAGDADPRDNQLTAQVEVVERKNRVLTLAGGPTREYQFVRNLLYRDRDVESHVFLQTGSLLTSQEAQKLLTEFPADREALSQYDAVLAFDADWTQIPDRSVLALEQWVAEQAGGLLLAAGSVEMPKWIARSATGSRSQFLRSLAPVVLDRRGSSLLAAGRIEAEVAWPLTVTPEGQATDFFWLSDDPKASSELWQSFEGVHSFYSAYELKPGAKALALFSDPTSAVDGQQPIYVASHFYGAGRVVFHGGGELWRLREIGDQYFDRYYTKLVRWISQGRLLLDSDRGILLVDREQALVGDQVVVRAVLKNERYEPLVQSEVVARLLDPQGRNLPLVLRPLADGSQPGVYTGQFPVTARGEYALELQLGGLTSEEVLSASVAAKVPAREMQRGERNDPLLTRLAVDTGGEYWSGAERALQPTQDGTAEVVDAVATQDQVAYLPGAPDQTFQIRWLGWLMALIAGSLSVEWISRRLYRLA